jgi:hypothetical protein
MTTINPKNVVVVNIEVSEKEKKGKAIDIYQNINTLSFLSLPFPSWMMMINFV